MPCFRGLRRFCRPINKELRPVAQAVFTVWGVVGIVFGIPVAATAGLFKLDEIYLRTKYKNEF